jgi:hypothetical protein
MFSRFSYGDITEIRDITKPENRSDPRKHLVMVVAGLRLMKGDASELVIFDTVLIGCPTYLGICDEVYYLNQSCLQRVGVPLIDPLTGRTLEDALKLPAYAHMKERKVYRPVVVDLYAVFHDMFARNTDVPASIHKALRPHGTRTFIASTFRRANERGEINAAVIEAVECQLGHSAVSSTTRTRYLSTSYHKTIFFGGLTTRNENLRGLLHVPSKSIALKLGFKNGAVPRVLGFAFPENVDIVDEVVSEILGKHVGIGANADVTIVDFKGYRQRKLFRMKIEYAKAQLGVMWRAVDPADILPFFYTDVARRFALLSRTAMREYTTQHIVPFLKL